MAIRKKIKTDVINKHDIEANWRKATGFIPEKGQFIVYDPDSSYTSARYKIGDGEKNVNDLPFASGDILDVRRLPGVTMEGKYYKIGAALNNLLWNDSALDVKTKICIPADFYCLEEPVVLRKDFALNIENSTIIIPTTQTTTSVPVEHKGAAIGLADGKVNFCGFKLGTNSKLEGGRVQNNYKYRTLPIVLMDAVGYYGSNDNTILSNAQVYKTWFYNAAVDKGGIDIQISGAERAATACVVKDVYISGGNPAIKLDKGTQPVTPYKYFCNGNTIDARVNGAPVMVDINGDGNNVSIEGQVHYITVTEDLQVPAFETGKYYYADKTPITEEPSDWLTNYSNYYILTENNFFDDAALQNFISVEQYIKDQFANDKTKNTNASIIVNGVRNTLNTRIYDLGNIGRPTIANGQISSIFYGHIVADEQSGHSNRLYNPFGTTEGYTLGGINDIYLDKTYYDNSIFAYAYERGLILDVQHENLSFWKPNPENDPQYKQEVGFDFFKDFFTQTNYRIFMKPIDNTAVPKLSLVLKLNSQIDMFGFSFFERKFTFKNYILEVGDFENGEFINSTLIKESICNGVNKIKFDYPNNRIVFGAVKITLYGREPEEGISNNIRMTNIFATNEVSDNMLLKMSGGSVYGPLTFEPETLKLKDSEGNVKTIEETLSSLNTGETNDLSKEEADQLYATKEQVKVLEGKPGLDKVGTVTALTPSTGMSITPHDDGEGGIDYFVSIHEDIFNKIESALQPDDIINFLTIDNFMLEGINEYERLTPTENAEFILPDGSFGVFSGSSKDGIQAIKVKGLKSAAYKETSEIVQEVLNALPTWEGGNY